MFLPIDGGRAVLRLGPALVRAEAAAFEAMVRNVVLTNLCERRPALGMTLSLSSLPPLPAVERLPIDRRWSRRTLAGERQRHTFLEDGQRPE